MNPIIEIAREQVIDYSKETISNFWLNLNANKSDKKESHFISFSANLEKAATLINSAQETILIYSSDFSHEILKALLERAQQRVRVYILASNDNSQKQNLRNHSENCLIRFLDKSYNSSFVLCDFNSNGHGLFFNGNFSNGHLENNKRFLLSLQEVNQIHFFYELFCEWFWKDAVQEIIAKANTDNPTSIDSQPFDFLISYQELTSENGIRKTFKEFLKNNSNVLLSSLRVDKSIESLFQESANPAFIYTNLVDNDIESLHNLSLKNNIYAFDDYKEENTLDIFTNHIDTSYLLCRDQAGDIAWIFPLTKNQLQDFSTLIMSLPVAYEYKQNQTREQLKNKQIFLPVSHEYKKIQLEIEEIMQPIQINDLMGVLNESDFASKKPLHFIDPKWSCLAYYKWIIKPPLLSAGLDKDPIYYEWNKKQNELNTFLKGLITKIEELQEEEGVFSKISSIFSRSKNRSLNEIKKEVEEVVNNLLKNPITKASEDSNRILKEVLEKIQVDLEERKNSKTTDLEDYKQSKQSELESKRNIKKDIDSSIYIIEKEIRKMEDKQKEAEKNKNIDLKEKENRTQSIEAKTKDLIGKLNSLKENESYTDDSKMTDDLIFKLEEDVKNKELEIKELEKSKNNKSKLERRPIESQIKNIRLSINDILKEKETLLLPRKIKEEIQALEIQKSQILSEKENKEKNFQAQIKNTDNELIRLKNERDVLTKPLEEIKLSINSLTNELNNLSNSKFERIDLKPIPIQFPLTQLPSVGILYQNKKRERFLGIQFWEELESGKLEAKRLTSILCCNATQKNENISDNKNETAVW